MRIGRTINWGLQWSRLTRSPYSLYVQSARIQTDYGIMQEDNSNYSVMVEFKP